MFNSSRRLSRRLVARADRARQDRRFQLAAELYQQALDIRPNDADVHLQAGHMLKESGQLTEAEHHYRIAQKLGTDNADLALQIGHLYKVGGRLLEAGEQYRLALALRPDWLVPQEELDAMAASRGGHSFDEVPILNGIDAIASPPPVADNEPERTLREIGRLVPELAPRRTDDLLVEFSEQIEIHRLGRREDNPWGKRRTLRGIEAVHGFVLSETPITEIAIIINGVELKHDTLRGGFLLPLARDKARITKYVFNSWVDFSEFAPGLHALELRFRDAADASRSWHDHVVIDRPVAEELYPESDFLIAPRLGDRRSIEEQVRSRPSQVHQAARNLFPGGIQRILVLRTDQLGDMVASVPALQRLRAMLPLAQIVVVTTEANADFARTLTELLDEVIEIDFPDDPMEQRRTMPLDQQEALRELLHRYSFDIALDFARAGVSRELLRLSGARFSYGMDGGDWPFLSCEFVFKTRDRWTGHDMTPHAAKVLAMVESLGTILDRPAPVIRRADLSDRQLRAYGLATTDRYVVLHLGARIGFSQWPHYAELAALLLEATDLKVVAIGGGPTGSTRFSNRTLKDARFTLWKQRLPFDDLDAILSFATVVVGNDSGPKHLAALRGTPVVTIFSARINWTEWGQENIGVIVSRKVPCAGCAIMHEPENCGKDFACIVDIKPEEICTEVIRLVAART